MITVLEAIKLSSDFLENRGVESPRLNVEMMLSHILKCKRLNLYLAFDQPLQEEELDLLRDCIRRRGNREPLQYILGEVEFYGIPLKVNPSVLIPRQETEILIDSVLDYSKDRQIKEILDIGTGSGNISIALAKHLPGSNVTAIDISPEVLETAKNNAIDNGVGEQVRCRLLNIMTGGDSLPGKYDIIVSNPPYIGRNEFEKLAPELRVYEPHSALTDNLDGLSFYKAILEGSAKWMNEGGAVFFEAGEGQAPVIEAEMKKNNFRNIRIYKDYLNIDRVVSGELV